MDDPEWVGAGGRAVEEDGVRVRPFVNWHRLEYVRVVDFVPKGIIEQTPAQEAGAEGAP